MRVLLYLGFSVALLWLVVFADHEGKKDDHNHDHEKKGDHHDHDHHHDNEHHSHANKIMSVSKIKGGNKNFAFDLFSKVVADHPEENVVFSPVSISLSLAFLSLGAEGTTNDQMVKGMGFNMSETPKKEMDDGFHSLQEMLNDNNRDLHLDSGIGLFVSQAWKIKDEFLNKAKNLGSEAFTVNFEENEEAKKQINDYVEKNTNGKIVDVLSTVNKDAALIFVNFIYFRGKWEKPFDEKFTKEGDFHVNKDLTVKVPFMSRTGFYKVAVLDEASVISVPYKGNASALFILPKEGKMKEVESHLEDVLRKYKSHCHSDLVDLSIPKFTVAGDVDLKQVLPKMGIVDLFSNSADLSGITGAPDLKISQAVHKAKISVDEKGTEAAGATVMEAVPMRLPLQISLSHPFSYLIYDHETRSVLFMGKVVNPKN